MFRYGLVGIASNFAGYITYLLVTFLGVTPVVTMSILYATSAAIGFWGNKKLTFSHEGNVLSAGIRYILAHCLGYLINLAVLVVMVDRLGYAHQWVQAVAILIVAAYLFVALKFFVFKRAAPSNADVS